MTDTFRATATPVALATFASLFGVGMLVPALPILAAQTGSGAVAAGVMVSVFGLARIIASTPSGYLVDKIGAQKTAVIGLGLLIVASVFGFTVSNFWPLCAAIALQGAASSAFSTSAMSALLIAAGPQQRGRAMVWFQTALLLSFSISPVVGGWAVATFGPNVPFIAQAVLAALAILAVRNMPKVIPVKAVGPSVSVLDKLISVTVIAGALAGFAAFFSRLGVAWNVVPVMALHEFNLTTSTLGWIIGAGTAANLLAMPFMSRWIDDFGARPTFMASAVITIVGCAAMFVAPSVTMLWVSVALVMFGTGVMIPASITIAMEGVPPVLTGRIMGPVRTISDAGMAIGPTAVPYLTGAASQPPIFGMVICLVVCATALVLVLVSRRSSATLAKA